MRIIYISDNALGLPCNLMADKPEILAQQIFEKYANTEVFIINVNYKTENIARADNAGILFLKYLRLNHFNQHCVLYSFLSREQLMLQDPNNSIIFSEGVTFIRMPEDLSKVDFESLAQKKAPEDLSLYFRGEIRLPEDERHNWANFWGIHRLWVVHKHIDAKFNDIPVESLYCRELKEKINSYNGLLLRYLYNHDDTNITRTLNEQAESISDYFTKQIKPKIDQVNAIIDEISKISDDKKDIIDNKIIEIKNVLNLHENLPLNDIIDSNTTVLLEQGNEEITEALRDEIKDYLKVQQFKTIDEHRKELKEKNPTIIYIDDQANLGWSDIFQEIIYGESNPNFHIIAPGPEDSLISIQNHITEKIIDLTENAEPPQLIMIDMRLKGEEGYIKIDEISGIHVLDFILKQLPKIPVIVITASNKSRLYIHIKDKDRSPRGFWIKEGIDSRFNETESVNSYNDLVYQLNKLIKKKDDYSRREKLANTVRNAENKRLAIDKIFNTKELHHYTDEEIVIIIQNEVFDQIKSKILFENLIVDTNYFCNPKTSRYSLKDNNEIISNLQTFLLLAGIYKKLNKKIIIPHKVYQEVVLHGMTLTNYANPNIAARYSFQMLKKLFEANKIIIDCKTGFEVSKLPFVLSTNDTYADPDIEELFITLDYSGDKKVVLISDDQELKRKIVDQKRSNNFIYSSNKINSLLKPLLEIYESITDNQ